MDNKKLKEVSDLLDQVLGSELTEIVKAVTLESGKDNPYFIEIPDPNVVDLTSSDLASLVARTSNVYNRVTRLCGKAKAMQKKAEAAYKYKYKKALGNSAKNADEREANAMEASSEEYITLSTIEAVLALAESLENGARVASESSRKLYDKVQTMKIASNREAQGHYKESDFDGLDW